MIQTMVWNVPYVIVIIVEAIIRYSLRVSTLDHILRDIHGFFAGGFSAAVTGEVQETYCSEGIASTPKGQRRLVITIISPCEFHPSV